MTSPLVTVIVTHHLDENHAYLKLCLDSILVSEEIPFEVICIADTKKVPAYSWNLAEAKGALRIVHRADLDTASAKVNWATKNCDPHSKYFWFVSDDVMVSKGAMKTLVEGLGNNNIICNPMSNSDNGSQFYANLGVPLKLTKEDIESGPGAYVEIASSTNTIPHPFLIPVRQFISFYCTMIPRKVWNLVGELDENLDVRHNDQDYCMRALQHQVLPMINLGAFALHFGDKTLPLCTTPEQYQASTEYFCQKYSIP